MAMAVHEARQDMPLVGIDGLSCNWRLCIPCADGANHASTHRKPPLVWRGMLARPDRSIDDDDIIHLILHVVLSVVFHRDGLF